MEFYFSTLVVIINLLYLCSHKKKKSEEFALLKFKDTKIRFTKSYEKYRVTSSALGKCTSKHKNFAIV